MTAPWPEYPCRFCGAIRRPDELYCLHVPHCPYEVAAVPQYLREVYRSTTLAVPLLPDPIAEWWLRGWPS